MIPSAETRERERGREGGREGGREVGREGGREERSVVHNPETLPYRSVKSAMHSTALATFGKKTSAARGKVQQTTTQCAHEYCTCIAQHSYSDSRHNREHQGNVRSYFEGNGSYPEKDSSDKINLWDINTD